MVYYTLSIRVSYLPASQKPCTSPKTQTNKQTKNTILRGGHRRPHYVAISAAPPKVKNAY